MTILNKQVQDISFQDVVDFCLEKQVEGIEIDYKKELPAKGIAKHFASFSNTRGGIIIVGVEEDPSTGLPVKWEGVVNTGKLIDRVHQMATNVSPVPKYQVAVTKEQAGKVFLLVRIFEGDESPYYVQNDSNMYVRTGNITSLIDIASPEAQKLLFSRREKAELARKNNLKMVQYVYDSALSRAETERQVDAADEHRRIQLELTWERAHGHPDFVPRDPNIHQYPLGERASMFEIEIQPFFPSESLITPMGLKDLIPSLRAPAMGSASFPSLNQESIPNGVMSFDWNKTDGLIFSEQLYSNGLIHYAVNAQRLANGTPVVAIWVLISTLYKVLKVASEYYKAVGFGGSLVGQIFLTKTQGMTLIDVTSGGFFPEEPQKALLPGYEWSITTDTRKLSDAESFALEFFGKLKEIHWSLGYEAMNERAIRDYLTRSDVKM